ncbi:MAG: hypothetical protein K5917_02400 [Clostridiales bacterium]|nr:hypothetical protein [Clostridiales bacterium]
MLEFKPMENKDIVKTMLEEDIINTSNCFGYYAKEEDEKCGSCLISVNDMYAEILSLSYPDDKFYIGEGLLRSAINHAGSMNAYIVTSALSAHKKIFDFLGFKYENYEFKGEIPEILTGNCHENKK